MDSSAATHGFESSGFHGGGRATFTKQLGASCLAAILFADTLVSTCAAAIAPTSGSGGSSGVRRPTFTGDNTVGDIEDYKQFCTDFSMYWDRFITCDFALI